MKSGTVKRETLIITDLKVSAFTVPTSAPESDGTLNWDRTTLVLVEAHAANQIGIGFSYSDLGTAQVIQEKLIDVVRGGDALSPERNYHAMLHAIRNLGRPGVVSMAISAVDVALWDLKAKILGLPLVTLLGQVHPSVAIYGSGGFTSESIPVLQKQLGDWAKGGIHRVKMKIGTHPEDDLKRVKKAREAIGPQTELFVDANGAYSRKQALAQAERFVAEGVTWFEEPVSSDDLDGLRMLRDRAPGEINIAAGEYGYDLFYFDRMLAAQAVDVLQADATRCGGVSGWMKTASLCDARGLPVSAHTAPSIHLHLCAAAIRSVHLEYFYDHVRIEKLFFDGVVEPRDGTLTPDLSRPGLGIEFKHANAQRYAA